MANRRGRIAVAAGTNGAGKSVIAGEYLAAASGAYFNPDLFARELVENEGVTLEQANARAWNTGFEGLNRAIEQDQDYTFETTLGGRSIPQALLRAAALGMEVYVFYVGLDSVERHIARVAARVARGGHPIPPEKIRERYPVSLANLILLLRHATQVRVYDNSEESADGTPRTRLVLSMSNQQIVGSTIDSLLSQTSAWAQPIVAAAIAVHGQRAT